MSAVEYSVYREDNGSIKKSISKLPKLGPKNVLVKITHSGLCGTDVVYGPSGIALGHEGVGTVEATGSQVTQLKVGDRVGGGYHRDSCGHCSYCLTGQDIWCYERTVFGERDVDNGTFGEYYIGIETYIHKIPDNMSSEVAAPLQCAGATVYSALVSTTRPGERVGVIGIGGLGHLAIQFAKKLGTEVVVFSTSKNKEDEARDFGASEFYLLDELDKVRKPVNTLLIAGSRYPDWEKFLVKNVLARAGNIVPLSAPHGPLELPSSPVLFDGYNVRSSLVASRGRHDEMLAFAAAHDVKPWIEKFELNEKGIQEAVDKLNKNKMRYRAVLVAKGE